LLANSTVVDRTRPDAAAAATAAVRSATMGNGQSSIPEAAAAAGGGPPQGAAPAPPAARKKVPFEKGYSQRDWIALMQGPTDLSGRNGAPLRRDITLEEVARHRTPEDGWTALRGKVYNLGPYLKYHPGGDRILLGGSLGRDCTALFNKNHAWVNADALLARCLVGTLAPPAPAPAPAAAAAPR
jgi:cytochrome-b5 reductase